jgi:hypothetical protein
MRILRAGISVLFLVLISVVCVPIREAISGELQSMSIRSMPIQSKERIGGFVVRITAGRIARLTSVPIGWNISIDNDPSWNTSITGSLTVGAAALGPDFFKDFLVIEMNEYMGLKFNVVMEVVVTKDFQSERTISLGLRDLILRKE